MTHAATSEAIAASWAWWPGGTPTFAASFSMGAPSDDLIEAMTAHVKAIDDRRPDDQVARGGSSPRVRWSRSIGSHP
ncbi:MAG: hypothetical protein U0414_37825 [Polyangiaceae bacterium]